MNNYTIKSDVLEDFKREIKLLQEIDKLQELLNEKKKELDTIRFCRNKNLKPYIKMSTTL